MRTVIRGTGMYVPPDVVDNHRLSRLMDTTDEWIQQRTGIVTRRYAGPGVATSDVAVEAARAALEDAGVDRSDIDYVVFATMTPDHYFPGSGSIFQHKLGLPKIPCLDIRQQCAGFLYGLQVADAVVRTGSYRNVLVVGAEVHQGFMPWRSWPSPDAPQDERVPDHEFAWNTRFRDRTILFGDGAGVFVVGPSDQDGAGLLDILLHSDGELSDKMWVKSGGSAYRPYFHPSMYDSGDTIPIVQGREVFRTAVLFMPEVVLKILGRNGLSLDDLDLLVMHQANLRINEAVQKRLGLPDEKVFNNIQKYGNTTAGTLPIAFHEAKREGRIGPGSLVCFVALGSGLNWGAALYRV